MAFQLRYHEEFQSRDLRRAIRADSRDSKHHGVLLVVSCVLLRGGFPACAFLPTWVVKYVSYSLSGTVKIKTSPFSNFLSFCLSQSGTFTEIVTARLAAISSLHSSSDSSSESSSID